MTISAPSTIRQFQNIPPLNRSANDYINANGVRICAPCYIDAPTSLRKEILNVIRAKASEPIEHTTPNTLSGISVTSYSTLQPQIEAYIGQTIDNLRNILFSRGGLEISLLLKLQNVTGVEVISDKDITAAFDTKKKLIKEFSKTYPFDTN